LHAPSIVNIFDVEQISKPFLKPLKLPPMNRNSTSSLGAFHPFIFFLVVYGISLFLAFFVCRTVYYTIHGDEVVNTLNLRTPSQATGVAFR
jgi:hypothetical protein